MKDTEPVYPNREHANADRAARRRAQDRITQIGVELIRLRNRIADPAAEVDGDETASLARLANELTNNCAIIGALREVREWHAADQAQAAEGAGIAYERWIEGPAGPAYAGDTDVKDGFLSGFLAGMEA